MPKLNCWEFEKCGRHPGGMKVKEFGVCPAATEKRAHGINGGINAGRACWAIAGTFCKGKTQGSVAEKLGTCLKCDFYNLVRTEEGAEFKTSREILRILGEIR